MLIGRHICEMKISFEKEIEHITAQIVEKRLKMGDPFIKTILQEGRVLYG